MEPELMLRLAAIIVAAALLFTNFDISSRIDYIKSLFKRDPKPSPIPPETDYSVSFLEMVDLWYSLKYKCELHELHQAADKLDEVFPLLNVEDHHV